MDSSRWWHIAVITISVLLIGILIAVGGDDPLRIALGLLGIGLFAAGWFLIGRRAWDNPRAALAFIAVIVLATVLATAAEPSLAIIQCLAYPLVWVLSPSIRWAIYANVAVGLAVGVGFLIGLGVGPNALVQTALTVCLSFGFSIAMGLWITRVATQSNERQLLVDELRSTQEALAIVSRDAGVQSERERLAREIHDTIAQDLTGLVLLSQSSRRELTAGNLAALDEQLGLLEENAHRALTETRALVAATAPTALENGGIAPALQRLTDRFSRETGIAVELRVHGEPVLARDTEVVLLRLAQEGLANVRKHSGATSATLLLSADESRVELNLSDNGRGFDTGRHSNGFGLDGLRDRLALVRGTLAVESGPSGTTLHGTLPLEVQA